MLRAGPPLVDRLGHLHVATEQFVVLLIELIVADDDLLLKRLAVERGIKSAGKPAQLLLTDLVDKVRTAVGQIRAYR